MWAKWQFYGYTSVLQVRKITRNRIKLRRVVSFDVPVVLK